MIIGIRSMSYSISAICKAVDFFNSSSVISMKIGEFLLICFALFPITIAFSYFDMKGEVILSEFGFF